MSKIFLGKVIIESYHTVKIYAERYHSKVMCLGKSEHLHCFTDCFCSYKFMESSEHRVLINIDFDFNGYLDQQ